MDITEQNYLELAEHAKQKVAEKEKIIEWLKYRLTNEVDDKFRICEYKIKQMKYLIEYKSNQIDKNKDITFLKMLNDAIDLLINHIDDGRHFAQQLEEEQEDIILTFANWTESSTESLS
jgi:hypothetical protein